MDFDDIGVADILARVKGTIAHALSMWPEGQSKARLVSELREQAEAIERAERPAAMPVSYLPDPRRLDEMMRTPTTTEPIQRVVVREVDPTKQLAAARARGMVYQWKGDCE